MAQALRPYKFSQNRQTAVCLVLLLFAVALLLIAGSDGWFRISTPLSDRAWFAMCGKSWMSGLTPYVDFTDSKGPLLWAIYGIGYLISPTTLQGLFIFELLVYWATFYFLYKAAMAFVKNQTKALLASMLCSLLFFPPGIHEEMLVEDYMHAANALSLFVMIRVFKDGSFQLLYPLLMGLFAGALLMMKYLYFFTLLVPPFAILIYLLFRKDFSRFIKSALLYIGGILIISVPFIIYLHSVGALNAFIGEYFLNTAGTVALLSGSPQTSPIATFTPFLSVLFSKHIVTLFLWVILIGLALSVYLFRKQKWLWITIIGWFVVSFIPCSIMGVERMNYFLNLSIFGFGGLLLLVRRIPELTLAGSIIYGAVILSIITLYTTFCKFSEFYDVERAKRYNEAMLESAAVINNLESKMGRRPTLAYFMESEKGDHLLTNAVAATRYWSLQAGMTPEMLDRHKTEILSSRPDVIITRDSNTSEGDSIRSLLEGVGYKKELSYTPLPSSPPLALYTLIQ